MAAVQASNPLANTIKDAKNQLIQGKIYETEVITFENWCTISPRSRQESNVIEKIRYKFGIQRIYDHISQKHDVPVHNSFTSKTYPIWFLGGGTGW